MAPSAQLSSPWFARVWEVTSDLAIAIALVWALPLLLGLVAAVVRLLARAT